MAIKDPKLSSRGRPFGPPSVDSRPDRSGEDRYLRSRVLKRSIIVGRHKTSVSLEEPFWVELRSIAHNHGVHLSQLVGSIDAKRQHSNLSSAIRLFVLDVCCHDAHGEPMSDATQAVLVAAKRHVAVH